MLEAQDSHAAGSGSLPSCRLLLFPELDGRGFDTLEVQLEEGRARRASQQRHMRYALFIPEQQVLVVVRLEQGDLPLLRVVGAPDPGGTPLPLGGVESTG